MTYPWSLPIFIGAAALLIVIRLLGARLFRGSVPAQRVFWCPFRSVNVRVGFEEALWDGSLVDVRECSVFTPAGTVHCEKACLALKRLPAPRTESHRLPADSSWVW